MKQVLDNKALELTMNILENWFCEDGSLVYPWLGDNMVWIGSTVSQFYIGKQQVIDALNKARNGMLPCSMSGEQFFVADSGKDYCLVIGRYVVALNQPGMYMTEPQRISCFWKLEGDEMKMEHLHLSNTMAAVLPDEEFPVRASKMNYDYVKKRIEEKENMIHFVTTDLKKYILSESEILYIEARKDYIHLYSEDEEYRIHSKFQEFINAKLPEFLIIHRSYAVNTHYIKIIQDKNVILNNGTVLPIARTRYLEVMDKISKLYGN